MAPTQADSIELWSVEPVYPGRVAVPRRQRNVALYEPGHWRLSLAFPALSRGGDEPLVVENNGQAVHDWLLAGNRFSLDLHNLRVPTLAAAAIAVSQALLDAALELEFGDLAAAGIVPGQFGFYAGELVKVLATDGAQNKAQLIHRPDVAPALGQLTPAQAVDVFMPDPANPALRGFNRVGAMTLVVRTD